METKWIPIDRTNPDKAVLLEAARIIRRGGLVAFPTETVYGLGANALDEAAAAKIYAAKGRPSDNPLIVHIARLADLEPLTTVIPQAGRRLMERYWPGPLTMVFPKSGLVPDTTTGGLDTVAVRMPDDPVARWLIELAGGPVAAPSANASGRPSPTRAEHVFEDMDGRIEMILDGGPVGIGVESTIVDVTGKIPVLLRPGAVTLEMLQESAGQVEVDPAVATPGEEGVRPKAPGMKYRHYAPKAELILVEDSAWRREQERKPARGEAGWHGSPPVSPKVVEAITRLALEDMAGGRRVGIICTDETRGQYPQQAKVRSLGRRSREETIAHNLFGVLREFDGLGVDRIYSESFAESHLGRAVMNRLAKAAGHHVVSL